MRREASCDVVPLPDGRSSESVDEEEVGFGLVSGLGYPEMDHGSVFQVDGYGSYTGSFEPVSVSPFYYFREAEATCHYKKKKRV